jgi:enoyl-CoA hydratase/carnithine racemase
MARPTIHIEHREYPEGTVAHLSIDNPSKLNILNSGLVRLLTEHLDQLASQETVRAIVLTGEGERAFIGGADIREMIQLEPASARAFITSLHTLCSRLREHPAPVLARINGYCLGAGMEIAASCDLRVASVDSKFGMPEVRVGIPSVIEAALLPRIIGGGRARELVLTGDIINAEDAYAMGFIRPPVAPIDLDGAVDQCLTSVLSGGPSAIRAQKALCKHWESDSLESAIETGIEFFANAYRTGEPKQMMQSFLSRKPNRDLSVSNPRDTRSC